MIENTIAAAKSSGARILLPGTIYNYGPEPFSVLHEDSPQNAITHKGKIRIALENKLEAAARDGVRCLIVRFGDFFGPRPGNNWFSQCMVKPHGPVKSISYPGGMSIGRDWAYLPGAGETFAPLMDPAADLPDFARFHFRGGRGRNTDDRGNTPVFKLASPFNETMRELYAMRPLWETPIDLDNTRLVDFLGKEHRTQLDHAMEITLRGLGCVE